MVDAFYADAIPFHLDDARVRSSSSATASTPGGVVASNVIGALTGSELAALARAVEDVPLVVPDGRSYPVYEDRRRPRPDDIRNMILVATERAAPSPALPRGERWEEIRRARADGARPRRADRATGGSGPSRFDDVPVLTDDYAPTDALLID